MLDELRPLGLSAAASRLGVDPLEVVRLLVVAEMDSGALEVPHDDLDKLRELGGIESWWDDATPPEDENSLRGAVRGALGQLLERGKVGDEKTRLDNLWRGLAPDNQAVIEQAVMFLIEEGKLLTAAEPRGVVVSIAPGAEDELKGIVDGQEHEGLAGIWQG